MMTETQIARLASMGNTLRPDWPNASIYTFIARNLSNRAYRDVAVALAWVAADEHTKTPKRLLESGPWWKAVAIETGHTTSRPPRKGEDCRLHAGQWAESCHGCAADALTGERTTPAEPRRPDRSEQLAQARALLATTRRELCAHGVDPRRCADHRNPAPTDPTTEATAPESETDHE